MDIKKAIIREEEFYFNIPRKTDDAYIVLRRVADSKNWQLIKYYNFDTTQQMANAFEEILKDRDRFEKIYIKKKAVCLISGNSNMQILKKIKMALSILTWQ